MKRSVDILINSRFNPLGVRDARKEFAGLTKSLGSLSRLSLGLGGFTAAGAGSLLASQIQQGLDDLSKQQQLYSKLDSVIKSTGNAAGFTTDQMVRMSTTLERKTMFDAEQITQAQTVLATFKKIQGSNFQQGTRAALDMATVMEGDLQGAIVQVGKALNDPIKGITALTRVGVTFDAQQKEQIKNFMAVNDLASAQQVILKELNSEFGGAAQSQVEGYAGQIKQLANAWGDLREAMGKPLIGPLTKGFGDLTRVLRDFQSESGSDRVDGGADAMTTRSIQVVRDQLRALKQELVAIERETQGGSGIRKAAGFGFDIGGSIMSWWTDAERRKEAIRQQIGTLTARELGLEGATQTTAPVAPDGRKALQDLVASNSGLTSLRRLMGIKTEAELAAEQQVNRLPFESIGKMLGEGLQSIPGIGDLTKRFNLNPSGRLTSEGARRRDSSAAPGNNLLESRFLSRASGQDPFSRFNRELSQQSKLLQSIDRNLKPIPAMARNIERAPDALGFPVGEGEL